MDVMVTIQILNRFQARIDLPKFFLTLFCHVISLVCLKNMDLPLPICLRTLILTQLVVLSHYGVEIEVEFPVGYVYTHHRHPFLVLVYAN